MDRLVYGNLGGTIQIPVSKSQAHRYLICSALSDGKTDVVCPVLNDDIERTADCLKSLGADITYKEGVFHVNAIRNVIKGAELDCGESGSTLRFMLPVAAVLGSEPFFLGRGRLPQRPLSPLYEQMCMHGVSMTPQGTMPLGQSGILAGGDYELAANVSSQFISGLLMALPLADRDSTLTLTGKIESGSYIGMTLKALEVFGSKPELQGNTYAISRMKGTRYVSPGTVAVEGDWSSAAFWVVAGTTGRNGIVLKGLNNTDSPQGDRAVIDILRSMGARIEIKDGDVYAMPSELVGREIDCADVPDLVPVLTVAASAACGNTVFRNISRLRAKESDRVEAVCAMLAGFGIKTDAGVDDLTVFGKGASLGTLPDGRSVVGAESSIVEVDSYNDHRIAMSGSVMAVVAGRKALIRDSGCVAKSYPGFFDDFKALGGSVECLNNP